MKRLSMLAAALLLAVATGASAQNPCNPCSKKGQNPCNPCAKKAQNPHNPSNPCAGKSAKVKGGNQTIIGFIGDSQCNRSGASPLFGQTLAQGWDPEDDAHQPGADHRLHSRNPASTDCALVLRKSLIPAVVSSRNNTTPRAVCIRGRTIRVYECADPDRPGDDCRAPGLR